MPCLVQVNFALGQVKLEVWWFGGLVTLTSVVLLVIIFKQKQFQYLRLGKWAKQRVEKMD